jgi:Holliday junction DNA helicase RuvA
MQIFREDTQIIFAFTDEQTRDLFALLQSVSGIGPKLAFTMLTTYNNERLVAAIVNKDEAALKKIPGVGAKGAARIGLELADKLGSFTTIHSTPDDTVLEALIGLGWPTKLADEVLAKLLTTQPELAQNSSNLLRAALTALGR